MTVTELRKTVIEKQIVKEVDGAYRMPDGSLVSKAKKGDLEKLLGGDSKPVAIITADQIPLEETLPVIREAMNANAEFPELTDELQANILGCIKRAVSYEKEKGPRWRRRATYWRKQARKLAGEAA